MGAERAEGVSIEPLVTDSNVWGSNKYNLTKKFPSFSWEEGEKNGEFVHQSKGLTFWEQPVHHVDLMQRKGSIVSIKLTLMDQGTALFTKKSDFNAEAVRWSKLITKRLKREGVGVPVIMTEKVKHLRKAWKLENSIVVLSANIGVKPDRIELIFYEREFGLSQLKEQASKVVDKAGKNKKKDVAGEEGDSGSEELVDDGFAPKEVKAEIRDTIKEIEEREAPSGVSEEAQAAVNLLNVYRFLSRVPYDVKADKKMNSMAEDAAAICSEKGELSHGFGHSTDKCNLAMNGGRMTMARSVTQYMNDAGANNRERRGHRRWCINHRMGKTGFGIKGAYSAMYSMDHSDRGVRKNYSYPGHGFYPIDYLHGNGWSYHIVDGKAPSDCVVQVWKMKKFEEKPPSWSNEPDGRELKVAFKFSYNDTVVFEPDSDPITRKGTYLVRLKGSGLKEQYLVHLY